MSNCFRARPSKERRKRLKITGSGFPDIPSAPAFRTTLRSVDYDFEERKQRYKHLIPIYTLQQVQRLVLSYHELLMKTLSENGYKAVVAELEEILRKNENMENSKTARVGQPNPDSLLSQPKVFKRVAETLKFAQDLDDMKKPEHALLLRKDLAVTIMQEQIVWLARHLLQTCLEKAESIGEAADRTKAECHCFMAYLSMDECDEKENSIEENLFHLAICRELSENQQWNLRPEVVILRIKKPIYIHGYRDEEQIIDGSTMHIYNIATLLEHELLIKLVDQLLFKENITNHDVLLAAQYTDDALSLAIEVREPEAMSAALVRFGNILQGMGCFEEAMDYFDELQLQAELRQDNESEAMGFHGLGCSLNGKKNILSALEMFAIQQERAEGILDLEAEACQEVGMTLLTEGQTLEAKASLWLSEEKFEEGKDKYRTPGALLDDAWALVGVALGQDLWGRYGGLTRRRSVKDIRAIIEFKNSRKFLPKVKRPKYKANFVDPGMVIGERFPSERTFQTFRPFMTQDESRVHMVQRQVAQEKQDPTTKRGPKKNVLFTSHYVTSSSLDYDAFSQSGSSQTPPSLFDYDMPYKSDYIREEVLTSEDDYKSGDSNSYSSKSSTYRQKASKKLLSLISATKGFQRSIAFSGVSGASGRSAYSRAILLSTASNVTMNRLQSTIVEKPPSVILPDANENDVSGSNIKFSIISSNPSFVSKTTSSNTKSTESES